MQRNILERETCVLPLAREAGLDTDHVVESVDPDAEKPLDDQAQIGAGHVGEVHVTEIARASCRLNVRRHTGVSAREVAIRDPVEDLLGGLLEAELIVHERKMRIFLGEYPALRILLGQPVGRIAQPSADAHGLDALEMPFGKLQRSVRLEIVDHLGIHDVVYRRKLHGRMDQAVPDRVKVFGDHALTGDPQLFIERLLDLLRLLGEGRSVAPDPLGDLGEHKVGAVVVGA